MARIDFAAQILQNLDIRSVLDVGCRNGALADSLAPTVTYAGADLVPDTRGRVKFVGDIAKVEMQETFDAVVALDILEHLESPSLVFDRLVQWSNNYVLVSLPNCYDLKSRFRFLAGGPLSGKYLFHEQEPVDRHRWLMNRSQIASFYEAKAAKHNLRVRLFDLQYGTNSNPTIRTRAGRLLSVLLPADITAETVCGLFSRR